MAFASLSSPHLLFWLNEWSDSISVIDGAAGDVLQVVKVGRQPVDIAANPVRRRLYVGNGLGKSITVLRCISSRYCPQTAEPPVAPRLAGVVNAAGGRAGVIAPNAYYSLFGSNLGSAGGAVSVYDTTGRERLGATVFTSPGQVNFRTQPSTRGFLRLSSPPARTPANDRRTTGRREWETSCRSMGRGWGRPPGRPSSCLGECGLCRPTPATRRGFPASTR
jgi:YVTN family beta-propeller protein